jgi:16S rRNA processing protein RimM
VRLPGTPIPALKDPVIVGRIARPVGTHGLVKVVFESGDNGRLDEDDSIVVMTRLGFRSLQILQRENAGNSLRLRLDGVDSIESAALLSGVDIVVESKAVKDLGTDEYFDDDIIGCRAVSDDGVDMGMIMEIMHNGHHDLWLIDGPFGEIMVPAVEHYVLNVDLMKHLVRIRRVEGLWEEV